MDNLVAKLYQTPKTVLTTQDLALLWTEVNKDNLKSKIAYYVKRGELTRLRRGVFVKDQKYSVKELAMSIYRPAYISFETVLREAGMIFQYYETIFLGGPFSKTVVIDENKIAFRSLKKGVLFNPSGIVNDGNISVAIPERAWLDTMYLAPNYVCDNLRPLNWEVVFEIVKIYENKKLIKRVNKIYKKYANNL